jgi:hypothetical protein
MANLSSRTGLTPVQTTIALANNTTTTIQNFGAYDAQELIGYVSVDADTDYRAAVRVTVVKNGAGTYEVAASDVAGDDLGGNPIVTFSMSGSNLQATLPEFTPGFVSASIKYHLVAPVTNGNYPLSIDGGQILSGTVDAARLPEANGSDAGIITIAAQILAGTKTFSNGIITESIHSGSYNYTSGTETVLTAGGGSLYLVYSQPRNYGGSDNRHGVLALVRRPGTSTMTIVSLAAGIGGFGVFTVSGADVQYGSTGGGVPNTVVRWIKLL